MPKREPRKWCVHCGLMVRQIARNEEEAIGRGTLPIYVHERPSRSDDPVVCSRSNLKEDDVTDVNWWNG